MLGSERDELLPIDGYRLALLESGSMTLPTAEAEVDGDRWSARTVAEIQQALEEADDFAIVQLAGVFQVADSLCGLTLEVNGEGLRNLNVDGTYLVPRKDGVPPGSARFELPSPLRPGPHELVWSYAWSPPKDAMTGEPLVGGVTLEPPRIMGSLVVVGGGLAHPPEDVQLSQIGALGLTSRASLTRTVSLPPDAVGLAWVPTDAIPLEATWDGAPLSRTTWGFAVDGQRSGELQLVVGPATASASGLRVRR